MIFQEYSNVSHSMIPFYDSTFRETEFYEESQLCWSIMTEQRESDPKCSQGLYNFHVEVSCPPAGCGSHRRQGTSTSKTITSANGRDAPEVVTELQTAKNAPCISAIVCTAALVTSSNLHDRHSARKEKQKNPKPCYGKKYYYTAKFKSIIY